MLLIYSSKIKMFQHIYNTLYQIELKYVSNSDYTTPAFYSNKNSSTYSNTKLKFTPNKRLIITRLIQLTSNYINTNVNVNTNTKTEMINQLSIANDIINNSKTELSSFSLDQHKQIVNSIMKSIHCNFIKSVQNVFIRQRVKKYLMSIKQIKKNVNEHNTSIINEFLFVSVFKYLLLLFRIISLVLVFTNTLESLSFIRAVLFIIIEIPFKLQLAFNKLISSFNFKFLC